MSYTLPCGCTPDASGYGYCSKCTSALRKNIWNGLSEKQREYDRQFGGSEIAELEDDYNSDREYNSCCSCHINPPCSYCLSKSEDKDYEQY